MLFDRYSPQGREVTPLTKLGTPFSVLERYQAVARRLFPQDCFARFRSLVFANFKMGRIVSPDEGAVLRMRNRQQ